jgi:REP element-mobilizing transposase RayT
VGRSRYQILNEDYPYFHTATIVGWQPVFTRRESVQIVLDSLMWLQTHTDFKLHAYVILENHMHFISTANQHGHRIQQFKSYTARKIIDLLEGRNASLILRQLAFYKRKDKTQSDYQLWQEGTHPEEMADERMLRQRLDYIHNNPVERGYVDEAEHWRYSSARNYAGEEGLISVEVLG